MDIEQYLYDLSDTGEAIVAYTMRSKSGASVQLCNMGAAVLALSLPNSMGVLEDVASGVSIRGLNALNGDFDGGLNFAERLWESRVETNRVVMSLSYERGGVGMMCEILFDFDDEDSFEITYLACADSQTEVDLTHLLAFNLGEAMGVKVNGAVGSVDKVHNIDGAEPSILKEVATIYSPSSKRKITMLSSQPNIYYNAAKGEVAALSAPLKVMEAEARYVEKCVYRFAIEQEQRTEL